MAVHEAAAQEAAAQQLAESGQQSAGQQSAGQESAGQQSAGQKSAGRDSAGRDSAGKESWLVGLAKVDITPTEPLRLSGYATRNEPHAGVADPLAARAMVLTQVNSSATLPLPPTAIGKQTMVMVSVDSIAVVGTMTRRLEEQLQTRYGLTRSDFVICSTHSHAAPQAADGLTNIFRMPLDEAQQAAIERYAAQVEKAILQAIAQALTARRPARLELAQAQAGFAVNRRVLKEGLWSGFGIQADGPVDRRVQLLRAVDEAGQLLGAAYMYACHCTTLGRSFNQISADWAGLAAAELERKHAGAIFLPIIGCGADANPEPRTGYDDALRHGREMAASIESALAGSWTKLSQFPTGHFGYAGLAPEIPSRADLEAAAKENDQTRRRWAERMLSTLKQMGRLPETYPAPIHTWRFGDQLLWVFLGGEVVVDYQMRLEKELPAERVWVAAYTDDVFAYVASERMRREGGYEVDGSMLYYNQPGRWQAGTEDLIVRRTQEILNEAAPEDKPRNAEQALASWTVPKGYVVEQMAAEPLVDDPVNIAFGHDGRVWVVEMADYPLGSPGGGRVRWLKDTDGDGRLDQSQVFLDQLSYPSSVTPWRDGVIVITSPSIFFAADRDGDGRAEYRQELLQGIAEANPQHRASGFEMGLDGWLHFTSGDNTREIVSTVNQQRTDASRRDVRWQPDTGRFTLTSGHTQFVRGRDEFNNWFGNVNNQPMFHYVVEDSYRRRSGFSGAAYQHLLDPPVAPPVLPASRTVDRFNDLYTSNRFTSACSSIVCRVPGLGPAMQGAALVCEPVHNLVARFRIVPEGASFRGARFEEDQQFDFLASSDPFARPVRAINAPDGTIWVVDMVRQIIEHPQWIPTAWQERLNLRAGSGLGRIYRVRLADYQPTALPATADMDDAALLRAMASDNGALRDLAAQQLMWRYTPADQRFETSGQPSSDALHSAAVISRLETLATDGTRPAQQAQALGTLRALHQLSVETLKRALVTGNSQVQRFAISLLDEDPAALEQLSGDLSDLLHRQPESGVLVQMTLTLGDAQKPATERLLTLIAKRAASDPWLAKVLTLVNDGSVDDVLDGLLQALQPTSTEQSGQSAALEQTLASIWARADESQRQAILKSWFSEKQDLLGPVQINLLSALAAAGGSELPGDAQLRSRITQAVDRAVEMLYAEQTPAALRRQYLPLVLLKSNAKAEQLRELITLLRPQESPEMQQAALDVMRRLQADETPKQLIAAWRELLPDVRSSVSSLLLERRAWGEQLVAALEQGSLKVNDLDTTVIERLRTYGDRSLIARSQRVLGTPPQTDRARVVQEMLAQLQPGSGDLHRGEKLFTEHCAVCHRAAPDRPIVGAPLENISQWNQEQWVVAILDPNRTIEPKYHQYVILTKDGRSLAGVIEDRSSHHLTLAAPDGKRHEIELNEIESLKDSGISLMPEGLETKLSAAALADLLTYLQSLNSRK